MVARKVQVSQTLAESRLGSMPRKSLSKYVCVLFKVVIYQERQGVEDDAEVVIKIFVIFTAPSGELSFTRCTVRGCWEDWGVGNKMVI